MRIYDTILFHTTCSKYLAFSFMISNENLMEKLLNVHLQTYLHSFLILLQ